MSTVLRVALAAARFNARDNEQRSVIEHGPESAPRGDAYTMDDVSTQRPSLVEQSSLEHSACCSQCRHMYPAASQTGFGFRHSAEVEQPLQPPDVTSHPLEHCTRS